MVRCTTCPYISALLHISSLLINLHQKHLAIKFICVRRLLHDIPNYFSISPQLIIANRITTTLFRHQPNIGKNVLHDLSPYFKMPPHLTTAKQITPIKFPNQKRRCTKLVHNIFLHFCIH
ncbi:hypothetical protein KSF78_0009395 [Schistosoma japonicum]|nr:hypothetical protein KSF78_0009395 [Schistosoma japonicum]